MRNSNDEETFLRVRVPKGVRLRYLRLAARERDRKEATVVRLALEWYAKQQEDELGLLPLTKEEVARYSEQLEQQKRRRAGKSKQKKSPAVSES